MKFISFIQSLKETRVSQFTDNRISTDAISIEEISHPINSERRKLFYKYAAENELIKKFKNIVIGEKANFTEKKPVTHFEYKRGTKKNLWSRRYIKDRIWKINWFFREIRWKNSKKSKKKKFFQ